MVRVLWIASRAIIRTSGKRLLESSTERMADEVMMAMTFRKQDRECEYDFFAMDERKILNRSEWAFFPFDPNGFAENF